MSTERHERLVELLADRALVGLEPRAQIELAELMLEFPEEDPLAYDRAAAAVALSTLELEAMPASLLDKIETEATYHATTEYFAPAGRAHASTVAMPGAPPRPQPAAPPPTPPAPVGQTQPSAAPLRPNVVPFPARPPVPAAAPSPGARVFAVAGWVAAAACLLLAIGAFVYRARPVDPIGAVPSVSTSTPTSPTAPVSVASVTPPAPAREETASALRERLLALKTTARMEWTATKDPAAKGATGDVVWNADEQKGTMRFRGLAKNDAAKSQYQLWIFDKGREEKYPVDGGVFDVDAETGDVVVAIKARLPVDKAALFAVTVERPGGVVVSKRERIVLTAKPAS
ncbi:MAG: anti-sigma factor [Deltaproteobacteria bacterium]|nr:anti-sigma factor [Deltaproteobacteria bacterium]